MKDLRSIDIKYLKGVGPRRADLLSKHLGIKSYYDLLTYYPFRYIDRSVIYRVVDIRTDMPYVQVKGHFVTLNLVGEGAKRRLVGLFSDGTGVMEVVWFRKAAQLAKTYDVNREYLLFGKPDSFNGRLQMSHPEVDSPESAVCAAGGVVGVYTLPDALKNNGVTQKVFSQWIRTALAIVPQMPESLPDYIIAGVRLMDIRTAIRQMHSPESSSALDAAKFRLKFEELFYIQLNIQRVSRRQNARLVGHRFSRIGMFFNRFYNECLPFELTGAQKRVVREIRTDMNTGRQMNRLLQGDVGSGKTLVALLTMLIAIDNGTQACLMAPTEILATQHFETLYKLVAPVGVNIKLLTGSTGKKERDVIHQQLEDGSLHILVGTHAVIEDNVKFRNLGFVVIDEQHRFGVAQRARLWGKNGIVPHVLVMTATPIPRTLAMTVYGNLSVSVIDELPPGRKPIATLLRYDSSRYQVYASLGRELAKGRQAYIVYPLIKENEKLDLRCLEDGYQLICEQFSNYKVAYVHGKMKPSEKDYQMNLFASGEARILVATTVIEVGVNVPNASVMVIENAERFGLSQLHQLRGRVGRGADQSYCILMTHEKLAVETRKRLEVMTSTTDGFVIAEADLKMRGPGDLEGTMQSGIAFDLKVANLSTDGQIVQLAHDWVDRVLDEDPGLSLPHNVMMSTLLDVLYCKKIDWSCIS